MRRLMTIGAVDSQAFFLIDGADANATLQVSFAGGGSGVGALASPFQNESNGNIQFITGKFSQPVSSATVVMENISGSTTRDGWGVDNNSIARVPVPAPWSPLPGRGKRVNTAGTMTGTGPARS